jgi:hypothetical protein
MSATVIPVPGDENADILVKAQSATGCGTHTRFFDDQEEATKALSDITNKERETALAKAAEEHQEPADEATPAESNEENPVEVSSNLSKQKNWEPHSQICAWRAHPVTLQEEKDAEEEAVQEQESEADPKMAYRDVPSYFYEEGKVRDTTFRGTHTRFQDDGTHPTLQTFSCFRNSYQSKLLADNDSILQYHITTTAWQDRKSPCWISSLILFSFCDNVDPALLCNNH